MFKTTVSISNCWDKLKCLYSVSTDELQQLLEKSLMFSDNNIEMFKDVLDYEYIFFIRERREDKEFFSNIFRDKDSVDGNITAARKYFDDYFKTQEVSTIFTSTRNSLIFYQSSLSMSESDYSEIFPLILSILNNNVVIPVDNNLEFNYTSLKAITKMMYYAYYEPNLPAYLKLGVARIFSKGTHILQNSFSGVISTAVVNSSNISAFRGITLDDVMGLLSQDCHYFGIDIDVKVSLLSMIWNINDIEVELGDLVLSPDRVLCSKYSILHSIIKDCPKIRYKEQDYMLNNRIDTSLKINGISFESEDRCYINLLYTILTKICKILSQAFFNGTKQVFLQDLVYIVKQNGKEYIGIVDSIQVEKNVVLHMSNASGGVYNRNINTKLNLVSLSNYIGLQDLTISSLDENEVKILKSCLYFCITKYLNYRSDFIDISLVENIFDLNDISGIEQRILNYNNSFIIRSYKGLGLIKQADNINSLALRCDGEVTRFVEKNGQSVWQIKI